MMKAVNLGFLNYNGSQLHHALAYERANELGETICYFRGGVSVKEHLVDLEDSLANDFIESEEMWNFIIEIPEATITETVVWQRLFISMCIEDLKNSCKDLTITRNGDDIMVNDSKLSVSIATLSQFSGLIHVGINIEVGSACPVKAVGLFDIFKDREPYCSTFGYRMASTFEREYNDIKKATFKVIGV